MSWEKVSSGRSKGRSGNNTVHRSKVHHETESEIRLFLETYKTKPCDKADTSHDFRLCEKYHPRKDDQRRNPYQTYYSPDDESCLNPLETMYHPMVFRTGLCRNNSTCSFGKRCSRAHSEDQLRYRNEASEAYYRETFEPARPVKTLASSFDMSLLSRRKTDFDSQARTVWEEFRLSPTTISLELPEHLWFAIDRSNELFSRIQEVAFEECLGTVNCKRVNKISGASRSSSCRLVIRGINHDCIEARIRSLLDDASPYFVTRTMSYGERIVSSLRELKTGEISTSKNLFIKFMSNGNLQMTAVRGKGEKANAAELLLESEIAKLEFWIKQEGYNDFYSCGCCYEDFNKDQGIICENGHFYCSAGEQESEQCFASLVKSQILQLSGRKDHSLLCPECSTPYEKKAIASNLSNQVFDHYQQAIVDAKVAKKADEMNNRFNKKLQSAVAEVLATHGNAESRLLLEAKNLAREARNTVLNLRCPHCEAAYFEFAGCMAIQCERCEGNFCAYCHQKTASSRGAHDHVRQCLLNETADGSYYATPEQIRDAQKRYRTREIKSLLRKHKKNLQNAVVIELKQDLEDLDIKQEALFELGNLM